MKTKALYTIHILVGLIIAWGVGFSQASGKVSAPSGAAEGRSPNVSTSVSEAFNFQGVLKENGQPVNGVRSMTFAIYMSDNCASGYLNFVGPLDVTVTNGLFNVPLDFYQSYFDGRVLSISVSVGGTVVG
jgi:hypothetical protein